MSETQGIQRGALELQLYSVLKKNNRYTEKWQDKGRQFKAFKDGRLGM